MASVLVFCCNIRWLLHGAECRVDSEGTDCNHFSFVEAAKDMFETEYIANHAWWEERAEAHPATDFYRHHIQLLLNGGISLQQLELAEVGDVAGKQLLHLQCHIGTDSLSWVRKGAIVTGVDFSQVAIGHARQLADEMELPATFVHSNVYELPHRLSGQFDVVFCSYGTIIWLHDLKRWAATISQVLKPGGFFYIVDTHPMLLTIDEKLTEEPPSVRLAYPYFEHTDPLRFNEAGSYADRELPTRANLTNEWMHSLSEILMSLIGAGLTIEMFGEHRHSPWQTLSYCVKGSDAMFRLPEVMLNRVPLLFSVKARKP
jgi:SAM-dependent methyltransferase